MHGSRVREADVFGQHGEDGVMYIRFLRVCFMMCLVMMVVGCAIILPINFTANDDDRSQRRASSNPPLLPTHGSFRVC